eukprot:snap_masked-scaffold59_size442576-processed-gene-0.4 protein:Tk11663 transcript:snap_masked-scaffold59_size442576-processed-gene-0.4-mRNA-1 annotation:"hypothetical protein BRAFLDRAFT_128090"
MEVTQEDPSSQGLEPRRSKICSVCFGEAETYHLNYGASACFSCRAFFRRTIQRSRNPVFHCKNGGTCEINVQTRRKCQGCRFRNCIRAGMQPDQVLNDTGKRTRFRKMIKKQEQDDPNATPVVNETAPVVLRMVKKTKRRPDSSGDEGTGSHCAQHETADTEGESQDHHLPLSQTSIPAKSPKMAPTPRVLTAKNSNITNGMFDPIPSQLVSPLIHEVTSMAERLVHPATVSFDFDESQLEVDVPGAMGSGLPGRQAYIELEPRRPAHMPWNSEVPTYQTNREITRLEANEEEIQSEMEIQQPFEAGSLPILSCDILEPLNEGRVSHTATSQKTIDELGVIYLALDEHCKSSRFKVKSSRTAHYRQRKRMMTFLERSKDAWHHACSQTILEYSVFEEWLQFHLGQARMTKPLLRAYLYEEKAAELSKYPLLTSCHYIVAMGCLFASGYTTKLDDQSAILGHMADILTFADWTNQVYECASRETLTNIVSILESMAVFFETSIRWQESECFFLEITKIIALPYTTEEECWLIRQYERFDRAYSEVSFGEEIMKEFIMFSYDVPLSKTFVPKMVSVWSERFRRIMKIHEEFNALCDKDQAALLGTNVIDAVSLCLAKVENFEDGNKQLKFSLGTLDDSIFKQNYDGVMDVSRLKTMTLIRINDLTSVVQSPHVIEQFQGISSRLSHLVKSVDVFKLLIFITMFTTHSQVQSVSIDDVQSKYLTIFKRRLQSRGGSADNFDQFKNALRDIRQLSKIITEIIARKPSIG